MTAALISTTSLVATHCVENVHATEITLQLGNGE